MLSTLVDVHVHQFGLELRGAGEATVEECNADWHEIRFADRRGGFTIYTDRATGLVPLTIELTDREPVIDHADWSRIVLAHANCRGGALVVRELGRPKRVPPTLEVPPGHYRMFVCSGDVDSCDYDGSLGADHYRIVLWPGERITPRALKACRETMYARRTPLLSVERCAELLASNDRHARWRAMPDLARHATPDALARLQDAARAGDVVDRVLAIGALSTALPVRIDQLEPFARDAHREVRLEVLAVVHHAILDFEFERCDWLDTDAAYRVLNALAADGDDSLQRQASSVLTELDGLAELAAQ